MTECRSAIELTSVEQMIELLELVEHIERIRGSSSRHRAGLQGHNRQSDDHCWLQST